MGIVVPPSAGAALVAGLATSLHCAGMCGPLACAIMPGRAAAEDEQAIASAYQVGRLTGYMALGGLAGGIGRLPLASLPEWALRGLPWLSVVFFAGLALGWDRRWARPVAPTRWIFRLSRGLVRSAGINGPGAGRGSRLAAAGAVGLATPLLPCGALYFFVALTLLSGSALRGAELMLAFGIGTLPLLWVAQMGFARAQARLSPMWLARTRVALAIVAAGVAAWRAQRPLGSSQEVHSWLCF